MPPTHRVGLTSLASVSLLWLAGPPVGLWPLAFIALIPWLRLVEIPRSLVRRDYLWIWLPSTAYWLLVLQGLRHAHPVMYLCWIALSAYLAVYHVAFVGLTGRAVKRQIPIIVAAPVIWVATELVRNYFLTGISAAMLGHAVMNAPVLIQIADLVGSYGVSAVLVCSNVAFFLSAQRWRRKSDSKSVIVAASVATTLLLATVAYGLYRLSQPLGDPVGTIALLQRDEEVNYEQSIERQEEIYQNYGRQSIEAVRDEAKRDPDSRIDVLVWPESMFSGASPWIMADKNAILPSEAQMTTDEFFAGIEDRQKHFVQKSRYLQQLMVSRSANSPPELLAGCGVIRYGATPQIYSGVVHVGARWRSP